MLLSTLILTDDERKSRHYLTQGQSADPSEKFADSLEDLTSSSETYHVYHSLEPPNETSSNEALAEVVGCSEVSPDDALIYAEREGCSSTLLHPPTPLTEVHYLQGRVQSDLGEAVTVKFLGGWLAPPPPGSASRMIASV